VAAFGVPRHITIIADSTMPACDVHHSCCVVEVTEDGVFDGEASAEFSGDFDVDASFGLFC
jgi:hypothetical protein